MRGGDSLRSNPVEVVFTLDRHAAARLAMTVLWKTSGSTNQDLLYCSGFAVELMLKANYLRQQKLGAWPGEMRGSKWHDIERLVEACRLAQDVSAASLSSVRFAGAWAVVRDWRSEARYPDVRVDRGTARDTFLAASDPAWGVFQWLMSRYQRI